MPPSRRGFLGASLSLCAAPLLALSPTELLPRAKGRRVVIVGGGWGGLTAARHLRDLAPDLEVVLIERNPRFWSLPLSNRWLANQVETRQIVHDYAAAAQAHDYTFIQAEATAIERDSRRVVTTRGALKYDWLVLAVGIRYDFAAWFGDDRRAIDHARRNFPCAFIPGDELPALKRKLDGFGGGDFVMTLPPLPYRCPLSPYERACMIGAQFKARKTKGRLIVIDPNPVAQRYSATFAEQYKEQIVYVPQARVKSVDPFNKTISTDFDDFRFDDAILMAPQQAGDLVWQAGLIGRDAGGRPTGWAEQHPVHLHAIEDQRVFLIGDLLGRVSPLFGHYPKSGHMANRLGRIAAREIAARARGVAPETLLPESSCLMYTRAEPPETVRIDTRYRFRGDGLIEQTVRQHYDPNPRGEDVAWAESMFGEFLAPQPKRSQE
jgi:NADPH-dependent 2,4-dienoyl-CoA reductase/sulfur reductase-like enzyme